MFVEYRDRRVSSAEAAKNDNLVLGKSDIDYCFVKGICENFILESVQFVIGSLLFTGKGTMGTWLILVYMHNITV